MPKRKGRMLSGVENCWLIELARCQATDDPMTLPPTTTPTRLISLVELVT
jgi:hypothetical protein